MNICKQAQATAVGTPTEAQLAQINALTRTPLTAQQVYVFSLRLCDDQPDRDFERFDTAALPELAALFRGKTGILDHNWSAEKQVARIFDAQVQTDGGVSLIRAWAYTLRCEKNEALIAEIEAGIKKEVSVGCSMGKTVCSICGAPYGTCTHRKGQTYDGSVCLAVLCEPKDAYEFSFVAVPAQRQAGVLKHWDGETPPTLRQLADRAGGTVTEEYGRMETLAGLGQEYMDSLRRQVIRLSLSVGADLEEAVLTAITEKLDCAELKALKASLEARAAALYPAQTQLPQPAHSAEPVGSEYLI